MIDLNENKHKSIVGSFSDPLKRMGGVTHVCKTNIQLNSTQHNTYNAYTAQHKSTQFNTFKMFKKSAYNMFYFLKKNCTIFSRWMDGPHNIIQQHITVTHTK